MKLVLKNFCCYEHTTFEFPDEGNVLISGRTGVGKSSIARAIEFALFGTGVKIVSFGKRKCSVEMWFKGLHIIRSKGPNRLVVNCELEDDEAQALIDKMFPDRMSSFLSQNNHKTFVVANASEKLAYLEDLAFQHLDLSSIKERVKRKTRLAENRLVKQKTEMEMCRVFLTDHPFVETEHPDYEGDLQVTMEILEKECDQAMTRLGTLNKQQQEYLRYQDKTRELEQVLERIRLVDKELDTLDNVPDKIESLQAKIRIKKRFQRYKLLEKELDEQHSKTLSTTELDENIQSLEKQLTEHPTDYSTTLDLLQRELSKRQQLDDYNRQLNALETPKQTLEELEELKNKLKDDLTACKARQSTYKCPKCDTLLQLIDDALILFERQSRDDVSLEDLKEAYQRVREELKRTGDIVHQKSHLEQQLSSIDNVRAQDIIVKELENVQKKKETYSNLRYMKRQYMKQKEALESEYTEIQERIRQLEAKLDKFHAEELTEPSETLDDLHQEDIALRKLEERRDRLLDTYDEYDMNRVALENVIEQLISVDMSHDIHTTETMIHEKQQYRKQLEQHSNYLMHRKYKEQEERLHDIMKATETTILTLQLFYKKILQAEALAIQNIIRTINVSVQQYLDAFFDQDPIQAQLVTEKVSKSTKTQSTQIHIELFYKENQVDLVTLSGGEYDRVVLAFVMALSEINTSPMIILDECVGSLDQSTATLVCDYIKNQAGHKLILFIAHQIVTGMFDKIITL